MHCGVNPFTLNQIMDLSNISPLIELLIADMFISNIMFTYTTSTDLNQGESIEALNFGMS